MKGMRLFLAATSMVFAVVYSGATAEFKVYPGAVLDERLTEDATVLAAQAKAPTKPSVYVTEDPFEKVLTFYKQIGKEYVMPVRREETSQKQASGKEMMMSFIILDGAKGLANSKLWVKIQRPYVGQDMKEGPDKTYITLSDKT